MRGLLFAAMLICALPGGVASAEVPVEVDEMLPLLADLASRGGFGNGHAETAAFIVRRDGKLTCELWPATGKFQQTSFTGVIPRGTVAIAHTHPRCCRDASGQDRLEAQRLGIPVVVVSAGSVSLVSGVGRDDRDSRRVRWSSHADPQRRCSVTLEPGSDVSRTSRAR